MERWPKQFSPPGAPLFPIAPEVPGIPAIPETIPKEALEYFRAGGNLKRPAGVQSSITLPAAPPDPEALVFNFEHDATRPEPFLAISLTSRTAAVAGALRIRLQIGTGAARRIVPLTLYPDTSIEVTVPAGSLVCTAREAYTITIGNALPITIEYGIKPVWSAIGAQIVPNVVGVTLGAVNAAIAAMGGVAGEAACLLSPQAIQVEFWAEEVTGGAPATVNFYALPRDQTAIALADAFLLAQLVVNSGESDRSAPVDIAGMMLQRVAISVAGLAGAGTVARIRAVEYNAFR